MRRHQKIAISRLILDLMKADDVICPEEISLYNEMLLAFDISLEEQVEAHKTTLESAMAYIKQMTLAEQRKIMAILHKVAYADKSCMAQEALFLLMFSKILNDNGEKYQLYSTKQRAGETQDRYVVYVESDYMPVINEEILQQYDAISSLLQLWNFEFVYIPELARRIREWDRNLFCNIIRMTNPRLSTRDVDDLYVRLVDLSTEDFTVDYLANSTGQRGFVDIDPSLLINVGWSDVSGTSQDIFVTNWLRVRLEDESNSVLCEVKRLVEQYESLITEREHFCVKRSKKLFHYNGLFKQLIDYQVLKQIGGVEKKIVVDIVARKIWMGNVEVPMSATQLATYVFILHQSLCTRYGGLIKAGQHHPLSENDVVRLGRVYYGICKLFRDSQGECVRSYIDDVHNIRGYIARIRTLIEHHIASTDLGFYYPTDSADKSMYQINIDPNNVLLRTRTGEVPFVGYPLWENLNY